MMYFPFLNEELFGTPKSSKSQGSLPTQKTPKRCNQRSLELIQKLVEKKPMGIDIPELCFGLKKKKKTLRS